MQHTGSWNWPADANGLPELLKSFGCADVIAPVDYVGFGRIIGELITRVAFGKRAGALLIRPVSDGQYVARNVPKIRSRAYRWTSACPIGIDTRTDTAEESRVRMSRVAEQVFGAAKSRPGDR